MADLMTNMMLRPEDWTPPPPGAGKEIGGPAPVAGSGWTGGNPFLGQNNPYLQQQIDAALGDTVRNYNLTTKPAIESSMVRSGSFGNSGLQQMQNESQRQLQQTLGTQANALRAADYNNQQGMYRWDQEFNRNLFNDQFGQNQQNIQTALGLLGFQNQFNLQDLQNGRDIQNTPLGYYGQFSNIANSIGQGYGTQTGTSSASGSPIMGAIGGAQLGAAFGNSMGWGGGGWGGPTGSYDPYQASISGGFTPHGL